jgi:CheY-like chemotaxis protein
VSLKILIADDSMTAQNMGKKILVDAGFDVVPVSNGAAAIKKIAETKPDIIILDIYMPGYTGLEVCEKVKNAPETANVPVLLTVGKLEPYRPEEGAKVKAEGVIIKPFEASDLLSALGRIAQKYNLNVPQIDPVEIAPEEASQTAVASATAPSAPATPAFEDTLRLSTSELKSMLAKGEHEHGIAPAEPVEASKHEVPSFIREATAAAAAPAPMFVIEETPDEIAPAYSFSDLSIPSHEAPANFPDEPMGASHGEAPEFGGVEPFSASSVPDEDPTASFRTAGQVEPELETTAAPKVDAQVEHLAEFVPDEEPPVVLEPVTDPALVTNPDELMQFTIKVGTDEPEPPVEQETVSDEVAEIASAEELVAPVVEEAAPVEAESSVPAEAEVQHSQHTYNDDPLVQMGVITIDHSTEPHAEVASAFHKSDVEDDPSGVFQMSSGLVGALHEYEAASEADSPNEAVAEPPVVENEFHEAIASAAAEAYVEPEVVEEPVSELAPEANYPTSVVAEMAAATPELDIPSHEHEIESSLAAAVERVAEESKDDTKSLAAAVGMDASLVARAVQKVFERYKEQMVADITDELSKLE